MNVLTHTVQSVIVKGFWFPKVQCRANALIYTAVIVYIDTCVQACQAVRLTAGTLGETATGSVSSGTTVIRNQKYLRPLECEFKTFKHFLRP